MTDEDEIDIEELIEAAKQGDAMSQCTLGMFYIMGKFVPQSFRKGKKLLEKSMGQGCGRGCVCLGLLYKHGTGVRQSLKKAEELFEKGALLGEPNSQYELG